MVAAMVTALTRKIPEASRARCVREIGIFTRDALYAKTMVVSVYKIHRFGYTNEGGGSGGDGIVNVTTASPPL